MIVNMYASDFPAEKVIYIQEDGLAAFLNRMGVAMISDQLAVAAFPFVLVFALIFLNMICKKHNHSVLHKEKP